MSADSPRRHHHNHHSSGGSGSASSGVGGVGSGSGGVMGLRGGMAMPAIVPPQTVSDRSILDSAIGFINDVTLVHQTVQDPKDTITWARFETSADVSDPRFGDDWELEGNAAPPLLLILGYGLGVQVWAIPANGEAVEVLSWRHGVVTALRVLPTPATASSHLDDNGRADEPVDAFAEQRPLVALVDGGSAAASNLLSGGHGGFGSGPGASNSSGGNPSVASSHFSAVNFVSLKTAAQVKTIKFKNPVLDIQANRSAVVISFHERLAVFDARTLEDRLTITTCFPSPGINPNPIALGPRWLAYAEHKLLHSKRSGGGCDGEGVPSYTATVLNAAKSFGKGLRELGEQVAAGLTGASSSAGSNNSSKNSSFDSATGGADAKQSGVVTIIDVKHPIRDYSPTTGTPLSSTGGGHVIGAGGVGDPIVAHFVAHSEALVAMEFDSSGMLLLTADRRGHDFHVFRIQPHPVGSSLAAVHHLYVLHRGDTSAKVQHIAFSLDSRWAAVSTLRGTTHVFPITPYGGAMGVRTHTSLHVVNKLSRFHRSAGLGADGRSSSPISHSESTTFVQSLQPYHNPTLPPFPRPAVVQPLAQLRQPFTLGSPPGSASALGGAGTGTGSGSGMGSGSGSGHGGVSSHHHHHHHHHQHQHQRQRLSSLSDDSGKPLSVCATFAKSRSWLLEPPTATREAPHRVQRKAVDSLFVMAGHGALIQYDLDTKLASNVAKEKICDDTPIELEVEAKAQWNLGRRKDGSQEIVPPLALDNWLIKDRHASLLMDSAHHFDEPDERAESWLAQVEIITHAGPHRRLWMGPQFVFKNYNTPSGSNLNHVDAEAVEIGVTKTTTTTTPLPASSLSAGATSSSSSGASLLTPSGAIIAAVERSSPLNMPLSAIGTGAGTGSGSGSGTVTTTGRSGVPVLIESGSYSSIEQSPKLMDRFRHGHLDSDYGHGDMRLKEDLADAMRESPSTAAARQRETTTTGVAQHCCSNTKDVAVAETGTIATATNVAATTTDNACYYDALAEHDDTDDQQQQQQQQQQQLEDLMLPNAATISALASVLPNIYSYEEATTTTATTIEKMVNPLGTVTDVNAGLSGEFQTDILDKVVGQLSAEDCVIHENCDEALFRPVVAIFCDELAEQRKHELQLQLQQLDVVTMATTTATSRQQQQQQQQQAPVVLANKLIVPVIAKEMDEVIIQKEKQAAAKNSQKKKTQQQQQINNKTASSQLKPQATATTTTTTTASEEVETTTTTTTTTTLEDELQTSTKSNNNNNKKSKQKQQQQSNKKDKKQQQQQQEEEEEEQLEELDPDSLADSLLENKESIAAVMMSSASAQGLNLHVEQEGEGEKVKVEQQQTKEKEKEKAEQAKQQQQQVKVKCKESKAKQQQQKELDEKLKQQQQQEEMKQEKARQLEEKEKEKKKQKQLELEKEEEKEKQQRAKAKQKAEEEKTWDMEMPTEAETETELETKTELNMKLKLEMQQAEEKEDLSKTAIKQSKTKQTLKLKEQQLKEEVVKSTKQSMLNAKEAEEEEEMPTLKPSAVVVVKRKQEEANNKKEMGGKSKEKEKEKEKERESSASVYKLKMLEMPAAANAWKSFENKKEEATTTTTTTIADFPSLSLAQKKLPKRGLESNFDDFLLSALRPLDVTLPPLPALEPLPVLPEVADATTTTTTTDSLINFESPLQERPMTVPRKITPPPRGFTEHNLILALCGSLHYEHEYGQLLASQVAEKEMERETEVEAVVVKDAMLLLKSTSTSATNTSNNSSGSEEECNKKLSKKQHKRAKQQQQQQQQQQDEDEELRPLISISMCDSQLEKAEQMQHATDELLDGSDQDVVVDDDDDDDDDDAIQTLPEDLLHFVGTTDSEDAVPATTTTTTTDTLPTTTTQQQHGLNKLKTKKLEHKINLIAAIEAATSSSSSSSSSSATSSAEESSVETTTNSKNNTKATVTVPATNVSNVAATLATLPTATATATAAATTTSTTTATSVGMPSATKKKTKRRKR